jgi:hypothetical protein
LRKEMNVLGRAGERGHSRHRAKDGEASSREREHDAIANKFCLSVTSF